MEAVARPDAGLWRKATMHGSSRQVPTGAKLKKRTLTHISTTSVLPRAGHGSQELDRAVLEERLRFATHNLTDEQILEEAAGARSRSGRRSSGARECALEYR